MPDQEVAKIMTAPGLPEDERRNRLAQHLKQSTAVAPGQSPMLDYAKSHTPVDMANEQQRQQTELSASDFPVRPGQSSQRPQISPIDAMAAHSMAGLQEAYDQSGQQMDEAQQLYESSMALQTRAAVQAAQARSDVAQAEHDVIRSTMAQEAETMATHDKRIRTIAEQKDKVFGELNDIAEQMESGAIDKKKYLGQQIIGGIGDTIAVALGAMAGILAGTSNPNAGFAGQTARIIDRQIERDIAEQESIYKKKRTIYGDLLGQLGDATAAKEGARAILWDQAEKKLRAETAKAKRPLDQSMLNQQMAEIQMKKGDALQRLAQLTEERGNRKFAMEQQALSSLAEQQDEGEKEVGDIVGTPTYKGATKEAVEFRQASFAIQRDLDKIQKLVFGGDGEEGAGRESTSLSKAAVKASQLAKQIHLKLKKTEELGVLAGPDMEILEDLLTADPTQINQVAVKTQLEGLREMIVSDTAKALELRGFRLKNDPQKAAAKVGPAM